MRRVRRPLGDTKTARHWKAYRSSGVSSYSISMGNLRLRGRRSFAAQSIPRPLVAEVVAAVSARVLAQVILVIGLGAVPGGGGLDGGRDGTLPAARRLGPLDDPLRRALLLRGLREDRRAVLSADVVALAVEGGRVVQPEEP